MDTMQPETLTYLNDRTGLLLARPLEWMLWAPDIDLRIVSWALTGHLVESVVEVHL